MKTYTGGCQCGAIRYEVDTELKSAITCNCSRCGKLGAVLTFAPRSSFRLLQGENNLTEYTFNKHVIHHLFCKTCGIQSFAFGNGPDGAEVAAINVRCLDDLNLDELEIQKFDGKNA